MRRALLFVSVLLACPATVRGQPAPTDPPPTEPPPVPTPNPPQPPAPPTPTELVPEAAPPEPKPPEPLPPPPPSPPTQESTDTTATFTPHYHFDLHWRILMLPELVVGYVFLPISIAVGAVQEYRIDRRFADAVSFLDGRVKLSPRFKFSFGDGAGVGLWIKRQQLFDYRAELRVGGLYRLNGDWQLETKYAHQLLLPGGRGLRTHAFIEEDKNQRYYGIGGETLETDRRVLRSFDQGATAEFDLQGVDRYTYYGVGSFGFHRQALSPGTSTGDIPLGEMDDTVVPPAGFNDTAVYVDVGIVGRRDTTDTAARPTRGTVIELATRGRYEVTGKNLSAVTTRAGARVYLPVLPDHRVLVFGITGEAASALFSGDSIPLDSLAVVGRTNMRGYDRERFRDLYAIVASAEYRFPIYEYLASRAGLDAFLFAEAGTIWGKTDFSLDPLRYSTGGGIRAAHETTLIFQTTLGFSPEGLQFNIGVEAAL
ncbi:MAG: BamA/TamA family outer membrane protein [Kofleriaceae bacterium]